MPARRTADLDPAGVHRQDPEERPEETGPARSEQAGHSHDLSLPDVEVHSSQRPSGEARATSFAAMKAFPAAILGGLDSTTG
ncbi:hypothetical protein, partial [Actinomadura luteofluorescens]